MAEAMNHRMEEAVEKSSSKSYFFTPLSRSYLVRRYVRVDPAQEISRMRNSLNLLEQHIFPSQRTPSTHLSNGRRDHTVIIPKKESPELDSKAAPGILGSEGQGTLSFF